MASVDTDNVKVPAIVSTGSILTMVNVTAVSVIISFTQGKKSIYITNSGGNKLYVALSPTCSTSLYTAEIAPNGSWSPPIPYSGVVSAIRPSGSGPALVTELL